jgi:hypothetical protein
MTGLYPQKGNMIEQTLVRDINEKVRLTQDEMKMAGFKADGNAFRWEEDKVKAKEVEFTEAELNLLKEQVKRKDEKKEITQELLPLCQKINK